MVKDPAVNGMTLSTRFEKLTAAGDFQWLAAGELPLLSEPARAVVAASRTIMGPAADGSTSSNSYSKTSAVEGDNFKRSPTSFRLTLRGPPSTACRPYRTCSRSSLCRRGTSMLA